MRTRPPAIVTRHTETLLPNGFCMFEFAMKGLSLARVMATKPLEVEVWAKNQYERDALIGVAMVRHSPVPSLLVMVHLVPTCHDRPFIFMNIMRIS